MSIGTKLTYHLPEGWTLRKVATAFVREWLPPFRAEPAPKVARWVVQSVVEAPNGSEALLWEPGISTQEYEERLDRPDLGWAIRASAGRAKPTILARLVMSEGQPAFQLVSCQSTFPDALFDHEKVEDFLAAHGTTGVDGLLSALLTTHGFQLVNV